MISGLHVVTDDDVLGQKYFVEHATEILQSGIPDVFHLRGPYTSPKKLGELVSKLLPTARSNETVFVINDRTDLALIHHLDGVHLGVRSLNPQKVREILGPSKIVGRSVHSVQEGLDMAKEVVDYLFLGSIFRTDSHPDIVPLGLETLQVLSDQVRVPVIAIGGVTSSSVTTLLKTGAKGVAVLRDIWGAPSPPEAVLSYEPKVNSTWSKIDGK
jgi:thiamine-phosphate diphosphorylase